MAEELYYNDKLFEVIDIQPVLLGLTAEKLCSNNQIDEMFMGQVLKKLKDIRLISYQVDRHQECCGHCGEPLHSSGLNYCSKCGSYNTTMSHNQLKYIKYVERSAAEEILADAAVNASNPTPFIMSLNLIEKITIEKSFFELDITSTKEGEPGRYSYKCGACGFEIDRKNSLVTSLNLNFCPKCGIPFRRISYTCRDGALPQKFRNLNL